MWIRPGLELRRERNFSTALIDRLPGIFFVLDEAGRTVRVNAGLAAATGRTIQELLGADLFESVSPEDRHVAAAKFTQTLSQSPNAAEVELSLTHKNGSRRRYLIHGVRVTLDGGAGVMGIGIDVTEARLMEKRLRESEQRFRTIFASVSEGIMLHDIDTGSPIEVNQSVCDMFGYTREEMLQRDIPSISADASVHTIRAAMRRFAAARAGKVQTFEWRAQGKEGREFFIEVTLRKVRFGDRDFLLSTSHDITERKRHEEKIMQMARFDGLTGLANRAAFAEELSRRIAEVERGARSFSVLYLDLDHFKDVNDTLGHPTGDALLSLVAGRLKAVVRDLDTVARFGGDEFAVLQSSIAEPTDAGLLAERILRLFDDPFVVEGIEIRAGASIGIAIFGPDATDVETLLSRADVALYRAKSEERGSYRFFTAEMNEEVRHRVSIGNDLRSAVGSDQFFLEYQPQVEGQSGRVLGIEALLRWRHPRRGLIQPQEFVPIAERNGLVGAVGRWVLHDACRQARSWRDAGISVKRVAVNLSAAQFKASQSLEADIHQALDEFGLPAEILELELTESVLMNASREHNDLLVRLRAAGIRLALDDFGTGYSSLDYLRRFPVDRIKIAQNFIVDLDSKAENGIIVRAAISLARALGISVLAEGVETEGQLQLLRTWGCNDVQGFYFSQPLPAESIVELLRTGRIARGQPETAH